MSRAVISLFALAAAWWLWQAAPPARGQAPAPPPLAVAGQIGGRAQAVASDGRHVVLAVAQRVLALDASGDAPVVTGTSPMLPGTVLDVAIARDHAYAAVGAQGLAVLALGAAANPTPVATLRPGTAVSYVATEGDRLYAQGGGMLYVYSLADPASPALLGRSAAQGWASGLVPAGARLLVPLGGRLAVLDVSDPTAPMELAIVGGGDWQAVAAAALPDGRHVLVADFAAGLRIVDIADPRRWRELALVPGGVQELVLRGDIAFVTTNQSSEIQAVDLSALEDPSPLGSVDLGTTVSDLAVHGEIVLAVTPAAGLVVVDGADPGQLVRRGDYTTRATLHVALDGRRAYALAGPTGSNYNQAVNGGRWLEVYDLANPAAPARLGGLDLGNPGYALAARGPYVYVGTSERAGGWLRVVDVSDPANPRLVGGHQLSGYASAIVLAGDIAWVCAGKLLAFSLADPAQPAPVGEYDPKTREVSDMALAGPLAYVATGAAGLHTLDVTDPRQPRLLGKFNPTTGYPGPEGAPVAHVRVDGSTAYLAQSYNQSGVTFADIADPKAGKELAYVPMERGADTMAVYGDHLWVADWGRWSADDGVPDGYHVLRLISRRNPRAPSVTPGPVLDSAVLDMTGQGDTLALAAGRGGLVLLRPAAEVPTAPSVTPRPSATPRPRPTRPASTPDPAWRRTLFLPFLAQPSGKLTGGPRLTVTSQDGGATQFVVAEADRLYAVVGSRLVVFDLADPDQPRTLGQTAEIAGQVMNMAVLDRRAYLIAVTIDYSVLLPFRLDLVVVDAADPARPRVAGLVTCVESGGYESYLAPPLAVTAGRAYVMATNGGPDHDQTGIVTIDTSDPVRPRVLGLAPMALDFDVRLAVVGSLLAVAGSQEVQLPTGEWTLENSLQLLSLVTPTVPAPVGSTPIDVWRPKALAISGHLALIGGETGIQIVDVANPRQPTPLGDYSDEEGGTWGLSGLATSGTTAFLLYDRPPSLHVLDLSTPASPRRVAQRELADFAPLRQMATGILAHAAGRLYLPSSGSSDLVVVNVSQPSAPRQQRSPLGLGPVACLAVAGEHLVVGQPAGNRVSTLALAAPEQPVPQAGTGTNITVGGSACRLAVDGARAYMIRRRAYVEYAQQAAGPATLREMYLDLLDVADPAHPRALGSYVEDSDQRYGDGVTGLAAGGGTAWLAAGWQGLLALDVASPGRIRPAGLTGGPGPARDIVLAGPVAYLATGEAGLTVLDARDATNPRELGYLAVAGEVGTLAVSGAVAWLVVDRNDLPGTVVDPAALLAVDLTEPAQPRVVGQVDLPAAVRRIAPSGTGVWLAMADGLAYVDAATPARPRLAGRWPGLGGLRDLVVRPPYVYAVTDAATLLTLRVAP